MESVTQKKISFYLYISILLFLFNCAPAIIEEGSSSDSIDYSTPPQIPAPIIPNEFVDSTFITNNQSFWKTLTELNSKFPVRSGTCMVNGVWTYHSNGGCDQIGATSDYSPTQVYRVNLGQIEIGSVYQILSQFEVTNNTLGDLMIADLVILSANPDETRDFTFRSEIGTDPIVSPNNGKNCNPDEHHCTETKIGAFLVDQAMKDYFGSKDVYAIVLVYSQNIRWRENLNVDIEQNKGFLSVTKVSL